MELETGQVTDRVPPFRYSALARVWFSDTDAQGVVYYGRYLPYLDHARHEYLRHLGLLGRWKGEREFVMRAVEIEYEAPAVWDDLLEVFIRTSRLGTTSAVSEAEVRRVADDRVMCRARMTVVMVDHETRRPTPIPDEWRTAVVGFEGDGLEVAGKG